MELDRNICYRALQARDSRFDGRFFTGVTSTGIYCRPVCPARTPAAANCEFFACAAAAEEAGYRACRRCRPETAPDTPAWRGTSATVSRALRLIGEGALNEDSVAELAARLGVGDRHLRRLFREQLGASPQAVARTRRAHLAKRLIEETRLPLGRIALSAGFANVRRFNAAIRQAFDRTPTQLRARTAPRGGAGSDGISLRLAYRAPLDWPALLAFLAPRAIPGVERVEVASAIYRRTIEHGEFAGVLRVEAAAGSDPALAATLPAAAAPHLAAIVTRLREQFDLDADPAVITAQLALDPDLAPRLTRHPGVRIPGAWDRFETAVRAILGQQITVAGATRLAGRLVERYGKVLPATDSEEPWRLFPSAADLAALGPDPIAALGMPGSRARTIWTLARAVTEGEPVLDLAADTEEAVARLRALPGFGDWTAQYVAMRVLGEPDAFPAGDLGLRKALANTEALPTEAVLRRRAEAWRPWRSYAALLLWREPDVPDRKDGS